ncbi:MAG: succinate dehydrogenase, hydrophobic membrane anchor protein [Gammaproteobacteria bacterium]|nr:MAG: succinate dehydrogenase, hydrophobic membrane anchor protein [Gammaproteobacteria bacterium]
MVTSVTSFGRSGVYDWMIQRVSAVVLAVYAFFLLGYLSFGADITYQAWVDLFSQTWMRIFSLIAILSMGAHAWIGLWIVSTDYLKNVLVRFIFQSACGLIMFIYLVWGVQILWGL